MESSTEFYKKLLINKNLGKLDIIKMIEELTNFDFGKLLRLEHELEWYLTRDLNPLYISTPIMDYKDNEFEFEERKLKIILGSKPLCEIKKLEIIVGKGLNGEYIIRPSVDFIQLQNDSYYTVCQVINFLQGKIKKLQKNKPNKKFIFCEAHERWWNILEINSVKDLKKLPNWLEESVKEEDNKLLEWIKTANIGDYFNHRLGVCFMVNLKQ